MTKKLTKRRQYTVQLKDVMAKIVTNIDNGKNNINIYKDWEKIIGTEFAKYLTPVKIQNNNDKKILILRCANGASITMNYAQNEIIERVNHYLGKDKINGIKLLPEKAKS